MSAGTIGTAVFALLAAVSSAATRTVEMAQVTTLPVLVIPFAFSAAVIPVLVLTAWIAAAGWAARRWFRWEPRR